MFSNFAVQPSAQAYKNTLHRRLPWSYLLHYLHPFAHLSMQVLERNLHRLMGLRTPNGLGIDGFCKTILLLKTKKKKMKKKNHPPQLKLLHLLKVFQFRVSRAKFFLESRVFNTLYRVFLGERENFLTELLQFLSVMKIYISEIKLYSLRG